MIYQLIEHPSSFDFFQAIRMIETQALYDAKQSSNPPINLVGEGNIPWQEVIRFHSEQSLGFPYSEISNIVPGQKIHPRQTITPLHVYVTFMGLTGPAGALPIHYTEMLLERVHQKDTAMQDFFDLFNHRLISLFYRAWKKNHFYVGYEEAKIRDDGKRDVFSQMILSLAGFGTPGLENRLSVDDDTLCYYSGHFARQVRSAQGLEAILSDYFGINIAIEQFVGQWAGLDEDDCTRLPCPEHPMGLNNRLGIDTIVGQRVWHCQGNFRVVIGPLNADEFPQFLPDGEAYLPLCDLVRTYAGPEFNFDIQLIAKPEDIPKTQLGEAANAPARLGWNIWLGTPQVEDYVTDIILPSIH